MLETLRAWLNGKKEYYSGVAIFCQLSNDVRLQELFKKGATAFTTNRLKQELLQILTTLKAREHAEQTSGASNPGAIVRSSQTPIPKFKAGGIPSLKETAREIIVSGAQPMVAEEVRRSAAVVANEPLYNTCKLEADKKYKEVMNKRALLFSMCTAQGFEDINTPDRIESRAKLALEVVAGFQAASALYAKADHVALYGKLPNNDTEDEENDYDHLDNALVKQTLDNLRKNYNKMIKREQTPERVELLQKHKKNIDKLQERWHLLKPQA